MANELVVHYQGVNRLLGSPKRLNRAIVVSTAALLLAAGVAFLTHGTVLEDLAIVGAYPAAIALVVLIYARLRFVNAGIFLAAGRVGVIGTLGDRTGVEASRVNQLQRCTLLPATGRRYGVLLFVDRSGQAVLRLPTADLLPAEGLEEFSRRSGIPLQGSWQETYTPGDLARRFPRSVARSTRAFNSMLVHRIRTQVITGAITLLFFVALFFVLLVRSGR
ncbi:MAG TPA: hypothetical protein VLK30_13375 [Candidatus Limnocylindrales bacterium]|nr:hypothetical protein [Candidatus Limnocylindrales bacterium]